MWWFIIALVVVWVVAQAHGAAKATRAICEVGADTARRCGELAREMEEAEGEGEDHGTLSIRLTGSPGARRQTLQMLEGLLPKLEGAELVVHIAVPEERLAETKQEVARLVEEMKAGKVGLEVISKPPSL
ncbi:MAG: hypothetical protein AB1916_11775 [Thermodesulfobacteriota bacterium]